MAKFPASHVYGEDRNPFQMTEPLEKTETSLQQTSTSHCVLFQTSSPLNALSSRSRPPALARPDRQTRQPQQHSAAEMARRRVRHLTTVKSTATEEKWARRRSAI